MSKAILEFCVALIIMFSVLCIVCRMHCNLALYLRMRLLGLRCSSFAVLSFRIYVYAYCDLSSQVIHTAGNLCDIQLAIGVMGEC